MPLRIPSLRMVSFRLLLVVITSCAGSDSVQAQDPEPEIGDYLYCSPSLLPFSAFGHGAIYVGSLGAPYGDVVERDNNEGVRFTTLDDLRSRYHAVRAATVVAVSPSTRIAAAARAVEVARAISIDHQYVPWYSEPYVLGLRDCVGTFIHFLIDVGATEDQVGASDRYILPGGAWRYYREGRSWDRALTGNRGVLTGGSQGGIESRPLWLKRTLKPASGHTTQTGLLEEFLPTSALSGELGVPVTPDILGSSNAISAAGMNYVDSSGYVVAAVLGAETVDGVYEHDYAICARVRQLKIDDLYTIPSDSTSWWWIVHAVDPPADSLEVVIPITVVLGTDSASVDSRYPADRYGSITGTVLNYQARAINLVYAMNLVDKILQNASQQYVISFANGTEPSEATSFIRSATYAKPSIRLAVENRDSPHEVRFYGTVWSEPRSAAARWVDVTLTVPGGTSDILLPVGRMYDALLYAEDGGFLDKAYVPSGSWFRFDDSTAGGTSQVAITLAELLHGPMATADTNFVCPPRAEMTGIVTTTIPFSYIGIAYSPTQDRVPIDISLNHAVVFVARGDGGRYRVKVESAAVLDNDFHGAQFTAPADWTLITIPFSELQQEGWGTPVAWSGTDIHTISFVTVDRPLASVRLEVDRISFLSDEITSVPTQFGGASTLVWNSPSPFTRSTEFLFTVPASSRVTLEIFDVRGRRISTLLNGVPYRPGQYRITWNGAHESGAPVAAGVYFWRFVNGQHASAGRVVRK